MLKIELEKPILHWKELFFLLVSGCKLEIDYTL